MSITIYEISCCPRREKVPVNANNNELNDSCSRLPGRHVILHSIYSLLVRTISIGDFRFNVEIIHFLVPSTVYSQVGTMNRI